MFRLSTALFICIYLLFAWNTQAQVTPAGTQITTYATLTYSVTEGGDTITLSSNNTVLEVAQIGGMDAVAIETAKSIPARSASYYPIVVKNEGNGNDRYLFSMSNIKSGWMVRVVEDSNNDGKPDSYAPQAVSYSEVVEPNQTKTYLVEVTAPSENAVTDGITFSLSVASEFKSSLQKRFNFIAGFKGYIEPKWNYNGGRKDISGSAASYGPVIYTAAEDGTISALTVTTTRATELWTANIAGLRFTGKPVVFGSNLFVPISDSRMLRLNAATGANPVILQTTSGFKYDTKPVIANNKLFASASGAKMSGIDASGSIQESTPIADAELSASPAVSGKFIFAGSANGKLITFDSSSMRTTAQYTVENGAVITGEPVIDKLNRLIYVTTNTGKLYCFSMVNGRKIWHVNANSAVISAAIADSKTRGIYFITQDRKVWGVNRVNGKLLLGFPMTLPGSGELKGSIIAVKRSSISATPYIWIGSSDGHVFAVNTNNGYTYYSWDTGPSYGVSFEGDFVMNDRAKAMIIASKDGRVFAFDPK